MTHLALADAMLTALAAAQGLAPLAIDLNSTHATNPQWVGHARFHVVWQVLSLAFCAVLAVALIWWPGPYPEHRFYCAACLTAIPLAAFLGALASARIYGGALRDPNGIPPIRVCLSGRVLMLDGNTLAVAAGSIVLAAAVVTYRWGASSR